jgi:hypothetical protein
MSPPRRWCPGRRRSLGNRFSVALTEARLKLRSAVITWGPTLPGRFVQPPELRKPDLHLVVLTWERVSVQSYGFRLGSAMRCITSPHHELFDLSMASKMRPQFGRDYPVATIAPHRCANPLRAKHVSRTCGPVPTLVPLDPRLTGDCPPAR